MISYNSCESISQTTKKKEVQLKVSYMLSLQIYHQHLHAEYCAIAIQLCIWDKSAITCFRHRSGFGFKTMILPQVQYWLWVPFQHSSPCRSIRHQLLWQRYLISLTLHSSIWYICIWGTKNVLGIMLSTGGRKMKQGLPF